MLMLEVLFAAKLASVDVGGGILVVLTWLACYIGCSMVRALFGVYHWVLGLCNIWCSKNIDYRQQTAAKHSGAI